MRDSLQKKLDSIDWDFATKLSFLFGLVEVGGSAGYLNDYQFSTHVCRVILNYHAETHFEQLTQFHFNRSNIQYPGLFHDNEATHVIVGKYEFMETVSKLNRLIDLPQKCSVSISLHRSY